MGEKKNTDVFEYVFTRKELKRRMWGYLGMYIVLRIIRIIFIITIGITYYSTFWGALVLFLSGIIFGMAIITVIYYRKAVKIDKLTPPE